MVLSDLPKSLDETYSRTLLGIPEEKREYARRLFQCLTVSIRPLCIEELAEILAIRFDMTELPTFNPAWRPENAEEAILSACSSLITIIYKEGNQVVQFSHFSIKEFLTSERLARAEERLSYYHILPEPAHTVLALAALSILLELDDKMDTDTIDHYHFPLAQYAVQHWVNHAQFRNVSSHVEKAMERLFDPMKPHFAAWVRLYDIDHHWVDPMSEVHPMQPEAVPLYYAALCGFGGLVERLLVSHSDVNCWGGSYTTPLHAATVKGHVEVVSLLLQSGADPNFRDNMGRVPLASSASSDTQNLNQQTPLHLSRGSGKLEVSTSPKKGGSAPLHSVSKIGHEKIGLFLLEHGADATPQTDGGWTPLHMASQYGHEEIARLLLKHGADATPQTNGGWTPLHMASQYGHEEIARLLLEHCAYARAQDKDGRTSLHVASQYGREDIARLLLEHGADATAQTVNRWTPLHIASENGHEKVARLLLEYGADATAQINGAWTSLHVAVLRGRAKVVRLFLDYGVDVTAQQKDGSTLLHLASRWGHLDVVRFLFEHGLDATALNKYGWTALHLASHWGHVEVARFLLDRGADPIVQNNYGWTPLGLALQGGHVEVARLLREHGADTTGMGE